ncbi:MAG: sigma-70 family RNA polymerase sigma factor [Phycisphaerales bacterium]|nr:sigma-70 family RNA polymerase sigma factor [Phycisphaerales bacterium]MCB9836328.1 sigma-70 family RNA polymerase sigma factor [Phycisphaera sp.]
MPSELQHTATTLLKVIAAGDERAADQLTPIVYDQLKALAGSLLVSERAGHTLQPTALVHEAYVRLIDQRSIDQSDRAAFLGLAATVMRRVLVDHARARNRVKRGGGLRRVELQESRISGQDSGTEQIDIEAMDAALNRLAELDPRKARLIELRFFGGLDETEAAELIGISRATASREWRMARSWLARELAGETGEADGD